MRKKLCLFLTSLLLVAVHAVAAPASLSIQNFSIRGGETKVMYINLNNPSDQITLVQFDMQLPEGLSIPMSDGDYSVDIAGRTTQKKHSLECKAVGGAYRFLLYSSSNTVFSGTSGAIISVTLKAASSFNGGDVRLENILLVTPDQVETKPEPYVYTIEGVTFVSGITISPASAEVEQRKTIQLSATVSPDNATDKSVAWSSANNSIAKVDNNGVVTGVAVGNTVITCEALDGSGVKATCNVKVTASTDAPVLTLASFNVTGDGIVGTEHQIVYSVKNTGGDFNSPLYIFAKGSKESQAKQIFSDNVAIPYGQTVGNTNSPLKYTFTAADTYRVWMATDAQGSKSLGEKSVVVTPAATLTAKSYTRKYGDENPTFEFTADKGGYTGTPKITCEATKNSPVGTYPIVITQGTVDNKYVTYKNGTLTIEKAPLTVTAQSAMMRQGTQLPAFSAKYNGFKNNDTQSVLTSQPKFSTTATATSPMGEYTITVSGVAAQNYEPKYVNGTLTIVGQPGDVNRDGEINTTDVADVVLYMQGKPNGIQTLFDADLNNDNQVNATDLTQVVNLAMTDNSYALADKLYVENVDVKAGADCNLSVVLTSADMSKYCAFQFDIALPQGVTLKTAGVKLLASHFNDSKPNLDIKQLPSGAWRLSCFSNTNLTMKGQKDAIVTIPVAIAQSIEEETVYGSIQNIVFTQLSNGMAKTVRMDGSSFNINLKKEAPVEHIVVKAMSYSRKYGEANPSFEYTVEGGTLNGKPEIICEAKADSPVGSYAIVVRKGGITNADVEFVNGTLTVTKAAQTLTWEQNLTNLNINDQMELTATATSGLPVTYTVDDNDVCEIYKADSKTFIICKNPGIAIIKAVQEGNGNYEPTSVLNNVVTVNKPAVEMVTLSIKQVGSGTITQSVVKGDTFSFRIIPQEGWRVHSLTFNGVDYTSQIDESNGFVTPQIDSDAVISIAYEDGESSIASARMEKARVLGTPNGISISGVSKGEDVSIYDLGGRQVFHSNTVGNEIHVPLPTDAVYLVKIGYQTIKIAL